MGSTNNSLVVANSHVDSLIKYVLDVKPYRTKLSAVVERYIFQDTVNVNIKFDKQLLAFLGADTIIPDPNIYRLRKSVSWTKELFSDGNRRSWPTPSLLTSKPISTSSQHKFVAGVDDQYAGDQQIKGLGLGVFNPRRWDGPGVPEVSKNNEHQQDTVDYFLSRGVHSFDTFIDEDFPTDPIPGVVSTGGRLWKQGDVAAINKFAYNSGAILYKPVSRIYGTISDIKPSTIATIYEEWKIVCAAFDTASVTFQVQDSRGNNYGSFVASVVGSEYVGIFGDIVDPDSIDSKPINFKMTTGFGMSPEDIPEIQVGTYLTLTPFNKVTLAPNAPVETWSLIKTNPSPFRLASHKPNFTPAVPRTDVPSLEVFTTSLDNATETATWAVTFNGDNTYNVSRTRISDGTKRVNNISLTDGCTYKDESIHFVIKPGKKPFYGPDLSVGRIQGDVFNFTTSKPTHYKVFGSVSGWREDATIGQWYWNGIVGFKIPKLEYAIKVSNSTIISSTTGNNESWNTIVSNNQILNAVSFQNGIFFVAGEDQIVGASADGINWTSDISSLITPHPQKFLIVIGNAGTIGRSIDGATWTKQISKTTENLKDFTVVPDIEFINNPGIGRLVEEDYTMVVGDQGTLRTSTNGILWRIRDTGSNKNFKGIAQSPTSVIIVGDEGTVLRSTDRINWTPITSNTVETLNKVIYDQATGAFLAVGENGVIIRSTDDGQTWFNLGAFSDGNITSITRGPDKFVAVTSQGWVASSVDGIVWTRYFEKRMNAVAYGNGIYVGVGGQNKDVDLFSAVSPVKAIAEPSVYTIKFLSKNLATVHNNITGHLKGLIPNIVSEPAVIPVGQESSWQTPGSVWSDEWVSFHLDSVPGIFEYQQGDEVKIYLAPVRTYPIYAGYDEHSYDSSMSVPFDSSNGYPTSGQVVDFPYDTGVTEITRPWLYLQDYYSLYHAYGACIFPVCSAGDKVVIDKSISDKIRFRITGASANHPELGAIDDWVPLELRFVDRVNGDIATSVAEFPDLATRIDAYSAADPTRKIFSISQPRICRTDKTDNAILTFDPAFFGSYMPFGTSYLLQFFPGESYGQKIRVKMTENFRAYVKIRINLDDIITVSLDDSEFRFIDIVANIDFVDAANIAFVEGGALPVSGGYDEFPFDVFQYDERIHNGVLSGVIQTPQGLEYTGSPNDWVIPKPTSTPSMHTSDSTVDVAGTAFAESFVMVERVAGTAVRLSASYDFANPGMVINNAATEYLITHNGPPSTPTLIVESLDNLGVLGNPIPDMFPISGAPGVLSLKSFKFSLPPGFTAPFRLTIA